MALDPATLPTSPDPSRAPLAGTRSQSVQRLQVGLFGLATMILLVGLANIITRNAEENEAGVVPEVAASTAATEPGEGSDPLADAGVIPDRPEASPAVGADAAIPAP